LATVTRERSEPGRAADGWRVSLGRGYDHAGLEPVVVEHAQEGETINVDGSSVDASLDRLDPVTARLSKSADGRPRDPVQVLLGVPTPVGRQRRGVVRQEVVVDGWRVEVELEPARLAALRARARRGEDEVAHDGPTEVRAIIPGRVVSVQVAAGDEIEAGQQMLVIEAMKMQNELRSPRGGRVERVAVGPGKTIELGELLVVIT
jgi:biotin carboxyl carrier protein